MELSFYHGSDGSHYMVWDGTGKQKHGSESARENFTFNAPIF
jgi:hypothetical protein